MRRSEGNLAVVLQSGRATPRRQSTFGRLLASVSIASVVVGLAAQSTLANRIAGLSLVLYRPFQLGDRLEVAVPAGVQTGTVEAVSLGYTVLRTFDNGRVVMSHSTIANAVMINHTRTSPRVMALVSFSIGYGFVGTSARESSTAPVKVAITKSSKRRA